MTQDISGNGNYGNHICIPEILQLLLSENFEKKKFGFWMFINLVVLCSKKKWKEWRKITQQILEFCCFCYKDWFLKYGWELQISGKSTSKTHQWLYYLMELPITPWLVAAPGGRPWIWLFPILIAFWLCFYKNRPKILQKKFYTTLEQAGADPFSTNLRVKWSQENL